MAVDFAPGVGDAKGLIEVGTGRDLITGEELGAWRWAGLFGLVGLAEIRYLRYTDEAGDLIKSASRIDPDWLAGWAENTEKMHWIPQQFHKQLKQLYPEITEEALQSTEPLEKGFHNLLHGKWGTIADSYNDLVRQWLDAYDGGQSLDDFLRFIENLREEYLDLYQQYLTGG